MWNFGVVSQRGCWPHLKANHPSIDPSESHPSDIGPRTSPVLPSKVIVERSRFKPVTKMHTEVVEVRSAVAFRNPSLGPYVYGLYGYNVRLIS